MIKTDKMFSLGDVLSTRLAGLEQRARAVLTLTEIVRGALDEPVRPHVISASRRAETTLVVIVDSGAWTAQVRFAEEALREALEAAGEAAFTRLWVRVSAPSSAAA